MSPPPCLEKGDRYRIIGISRHRDEPHHMPEHSISVTIEDAAKGLSDAPLSLRPVVAVGRCGTGIHTL